MNAKSLPDSIGDVLKSQIIESSVRNIQCYGISSRKLVKVKTKWTTRTRFLGCADPRAHSEEGPSTALGRSLYRSGESPG